MRGWMWSAIPEAYRAAHCYTDFWKADNLVMPEGQPTCAGKGRGETAQVEQWNISEPSDSTTNALPHKLKPTIDSPFILFGWLFGLYP
jgi:hypothetical protein